MPFDESDIFGDDASMEDSVEPVSHVDREWNKLHSEFTNVRQS